VNITLIGMSGVGKSGIGRELSKRVGYIFIDIDEIIEKSSGKKLQEMIDELGNEKFLTTEEKTILGIGRIDNSVISPGGSSIYSEMAMNFLKSISKIVFLNATLEEIEKRNSDFSKRGIVGLEKGLEKLFDERLPLYRKYADIVIDLKSGYSYDSAVNRIVKDVIFFNDVLY
jgi:shikimate kinase